MIYDCFTFFNELDLLEIRLETLDKIVDKFILVEATKTHSNNEKPLYFNENKKRFEKWQDKIIHIVVDRYPEYKTSWTFENYQRNCIMEGLKECCDDDIIIISDLDEIPRPESILEAASTPGIKSLEMVYYCYYFNYQNYLSPKWSAAKVLRYGDFFNQFDVDYNTYLIKELNEDTTPTKIRHVRSKHIKNAGWHFTYFGGANKIKYKLLSFSHQEWHDKKDPNRVIDDKVIEDRIRQGKSAIGSSISGLTTVPLDSTFPECIYNNQKKYLMYICDFPPKNQFVQTYNKIAWFLLHGCRQKIGEVYFTSCPDKIQKYMQNIKRVTHHAKYE